MSRTTAAAWSSAFEASAVLVLLNTAHDRSQNCCHHAVWFGHAAAGVMLLAARSSSCLRKSFADLVPIAVCVKTLMVC